MDSSNEPQPVVLLTNDEELDKHINEIYQNMQRYEAMVCEIQSEAAKFRDENLLLRENLAAIIAENTRLKSQNGNDPLGVFRNDYIKIADGIFNNLRNQIFLVKKERDMFESMWSKTEAVLKREVPIMSSVSQLKEKHSLEMNRLNEELSKAKSSLEVQNNINKVLQANTRRFMEKLENFQKENKVLIERLRTTENEKTEIEKCLVESNELNKEQMQKSNETFQKLQETIQLADDAIAEINVLQTEKNRMEAECNNLASSIGSVIESASEKIDKDVEELKVKHRKESESCRSEIQQLKQMIKLEVEKKDLAHEKLKTVEDNLKLVEKANSFLRKDLESANKEMIATNKNISVVKQTVGENDSSQKEIVKLKKIIDHNRKSRIKLKVLLLEITKKLEERISGLVVENQKLKLTK